MIKKIDNEAKVDGTTWYPTNLKRCIAHIPRTNLEEIQSNELEYGESGGKNYRFVVKCDNEEIATIVAALLRAVNL